MKHSLIFVSLIVGTTLILVSYAIDFDRRANMHDFLTENGYDHYRILASEDADISSRQARVKGRVYYVKTWSNTSAEVKVLQVFVRTDAGKGSVRIL